MSNRSKKGRRLAPGVWRLEDGRIWIKTSVMNPRTQKRLWAEDTMEAGTTLGQAIDRRDALKTQRLAGETKDPSAPPTLTVFAQQWLAQHASRWRRATVDGRIRTLQNWILPHLGDLHIDNITMDDVIAWVVMAENSGRARETVKGWWRLLCQILRDGCARHGLADPTWRVRAPKPAASVRIFARERRTLSERDLGLLFEELQEAHGLQRTTEALVLGWTGMRLGELLALSWDCYDKSLGQLTIAHSRNLGETNATKADRVRHVPVSDDLAGALDRWRHHCVAVQHPGLHTGLIFPAIRQTQATHRSKSALRRSLIAAGQGAGIKVKVTPQVLRRTFNTLLLSKGVDRAVIQAIIGHCSDAMTDQYAGVRQETKIEATKVLDLGRV